MAARVESETETDSETSGRQPFISRKREHKKGTSMLFFFY